MIQHISAEFGFYEHDPD